MASGADASPASLRHEVLVLKAAVASCQKENKALTGTLAARDTQNKELQRQVRQRKCASTWGAAGVLTPQLCVVCIRVCAWGWGGEDSCS